MIIRKIWVGKHAFSIIRRSKVKQGEQKMEK